MHEFQESTMSKQASIRNRLETDAWRNHPQFARRLARAGRPEPRRRLAWQDRVLLILAAALVLLLIVRMEAARADDGGAFWGLEFQGDAAARRAVALHTEISVEITALAARVEVTQAFRNTGLAWAEATYRYPLPAGAAVDRMTIRVGDRLLEGEIREKQDARRRYVQARRDGQVASLVEQERANQFQTRLANIGPGEEIRVTIGFLATVDYRDGDFSLRIPLTFTPRWDGAGESAAASIAAGSSAHPLILPATGLDDHRLSIDVDLRAGMNLARIESRYHDVDIEPSPQGYRIYLADPDTRADRIFELSWSPDYGPAPVSTLATYADGEDVYALLMLAPPLAEAVAPRPREVVFIIDTSGSMEGASLTQAKAALHQGLHALGPHDRFNLIRFSSATRALFDESMPVYPAYLAEAADFIDGLRANGGTVMAPALDRAMGLPVQPDLLRQIVFVTDGSVGNERELLFRIGEKLGDSRLFTVSIGTAPNGWFMRKAAAIGRGSHTHIGALTEVEERMAGLWSRIENPAVQNLCVDWGMNAEFYPEIIPDLYAGEPLWLYARLPRSPRQVTVCGELDGRGWELESRLLPGRGSEALAALWARSKIEALEDSRLFGEDPDSVRLGVLDLALEFGLLTPYTSLVAVDRTPARPASEHLEDNQVPSLLPAGSTLAGGFSQTATGWPARLILGFVCLLIATGMLLYTPPSRDRPGSARPPMAPSSP
jgi:Ca-activated chloride channel family protein